MSMTNYRSWFIFKNLLLVVFLGFFMESATIAQEQNELFSHSKNSQENTLNETLGDLLDNESVKVSDYADQNDSFKIQHQSGSAFLANSLPSYFKKPDFFYSFLSQAP
jgi:hypothetical protein